MLFFMSLAEIQQEIVRLSPDERARLASFLSDLSQADEPGLGDRLDAAFDEIQAGQGVDRTRLLKAVEEWEAKGR